MKRKAEPAIVEEEDPETGEPVVGTEKSASILLSPEQKDNQRRRWGRRSSEFLGDSTSKYLGSMLDVVNQAKKGNLLTIHAGDHDDNSEVWKECERSGSKYRVFYKKDKIVNGESHTHIEREILVSKEGGDLEHDTPEMTIAQRTYTTNGRIDLKAHQLYFRGRVDLDRPYIFPKLGDEIPGVGCPDLHCAFRAIRDFDTVVKGAKFANCDRDVSIEITAADVGEGREITFDFEKDKVLSTDSKPKLGILISCADFKPLYDGLHAPMQDPGDAYPSPPSKKQRRDGSVSRARVSLQHKQSKMIGVKLIGMGPEVDGSVRADLNINLVLRF